MVEQSEYTFYLILIGILMLCSFFFSGSETALTGVSRARLFRLIKEGNKRAVLVDKLRKNKESLIGSLLLGNNLVNNAMASLATVLAISLWGEEFGPLYATLIITILVLIFCEVLPKTIAFGQAERFALLVSPLVRLVIRARYPVAAGAVALLWPSPQVPTIEVIVTMRPKRAFIHCSSAAVYQWKNGEPVSEGDPLGDHHRVMMPTYSLCKIAAESVVRFCARQWSTPTTIARLGVPYGDNGGWPWYHLMMMKAGVPIPVHPSGPNRFPLFHEDDLARTLDALVELASVPATLVNWAGSEDTSIEAWCEELARLTGLAPKLDRTAKALAPLPLDVRKLEARAGRSQVAWRDGLRRMLIARNPELLKA